VNITTSAPTPSFFETPPAARTLAQKAGVVATALAVFWIFVCTVSALWFCRTTPLTTTDVQWASWLSHPTTTMHFQGVFGFAMGATTLLLGTFNAYLYRTPVPFLVALALGLVLWSGGEAYTLRVGVLEGHAKLGCFVENTRECRSMLGLPVGEAPSRFSIAPGQPGGGEDSTEYTAQLDKVVTPTLKEQAALQNAPGISFIFAPFYVGRAAELNARLARQRAEVAALKAVAVPAK
jgi:hypothetical protein